MMKSGGSIRPKMNPHISESIILHPLFDAYKNTRYAAIAYTNTEIAIAMLMLVPLTPIFRIK